MISDYYKLDDNKDLEYTMADLQRVEFKHDRSMEAFWNSWNDCLNRVNKDCVQEAFIERMFFDQLKKSHVLKEDIAHYNRQEVGHEHKNRAYLSRCVVRYLDRIRKDANRDEIAAAFNGERHMRAMPSAGTPEVQKICGFHARGSCKYGDRCALKHEGPPGSGKGSPKGKGKDQEEKGKGKGKGKQKGKTGGKSRSQSPAHTQSPRSKNLPCWAWNEGKCERNPCPFVHRALTDEEKKNKPVRPRSPAAAGAKVCSFFMKGKCNKGKECKDQHPGDGSVPGTPRPSKKRGGGASGASPAPQS
jgi:hypothetical protein